MMRWMRRRSPYRRRHRGQCEFVPRRRRAAQQQVERRVGQPVEEPSPCGGLHRRPGRPGGARPGADAARERSSLRSERRAWRGRRRSLREGVGVAHVELGDGPERDRAGSRQTAGEREAAWGEVGSGEPYERCGRRRGGEGPVGETEHERTDGPPLEVIGVQQTLGRDAAADQGELPAEVDGVLDAGVHALGTCRAVDVGGVAGQERLTRPDTSRRGGGGSGTRSTTSGWRAGPFRRWRCRRPTAARQGPPAPASVGNRPLHRRGSCRATGSRGEQPPRSRAKQWKEEERSVRAEPDMRRAGLESIGVSVREEEGLRVAAARERDAGLFPHGGVRAVASDQISGLAPADVARWPRRGRTGGSPSAAGVDSTSLVFHCTSTRCCARWSTSACSVSAWDRKRRNG